MAEADKGGADKPAAGPKLEEEAGGSVIDAQQLFGSRREVLIEHAGTRYRLRITRRGKLILQK